MSFNQSSSEIKILLLSYSEPIIDPSIVVSHQLVNELNLEIKNKLMYP